MSRAGGLYSGVRSTDFRPSAQGLFPGSRFACPPYVAGPSFPLVSSKMVGAILSGEFIDLDSLLDESSKLDPPAFSLLRGRLILRPSKKKRAIHDICSYIKAFSIYTLVLTTYYPNRVTDLLRYSLLIIRISRHFPGFGWRSYDRALRHEAVATKLTDWSKLNTELFNFYIEQLFLNNNFFIECYRLPQSRRPPVTHTQKHAVTPQSAIVCRLWNAGHCSSSFRTCRFRHACDFASCLRSHCSSQFHRTLQTPRS